MSHFALSNFSVDRPIIETYSTSVTHIQKESFIEAGTLAPAIAYFFAKERPSPEVPPEKAAMSRCTRTIQILRTGDKHMLASNVESRCFKLTPRKRLRHESLSTSIATLSLSHQSCERENTEQKSPEKLHKNSN